MRSAALGVALLVAVVSGCSAEAEPAEVGPLASGTASASAAPTGRATQAPGEPLTPSGSVAPSAAQFPSPEGAAAFARHYFDQLNQAFATADARRVRQLSDPDCEGCTNLIGAIEAPVDEGERIEGGDFRLVYAEAREIAPGDSLVDVRYSVSPVRVLGTDGDVIETRPGTAAIDGQLRLIMSNAGWVVRGFRNTPT